MSGATDGVTETEQHVGHEVSSATDSERYPGTCARCLRQYERVLCVRGLGKLCPACFNVLEEVDNSAVLEMIEEVEDE